MEKYEDLKQRMTNKVKQKFVEAGIPDI